MSVGPLWQPDDRESSQQRRVRPGAQLWLFAPSFEPIPSPPQSSRRPCVAKKKRIRLFVVPRVEELLDSSWDEHYAEGVYAW